MPLTLVKMAIRYTRNTPTDFERSLWILYLRYWYNSSFILCIIAIKELLSHLLHFYVSQNNKTISIFYISWMILFTHLWIYSCSFQICNYGFHFWKSKRGPFIILVPKSFHDQFVATLYWRGQGIQNDGDNEWGEKGIPMLSEF